MNIRAYTCRVGIRIIRLSFFVSVNNKLSLILMTITHGYNYNVYDIWAISLYF